MDSDRTWQISLPSEPVTDEYLESVTIGGRKPLNDRIRLSEYDPGWPSVYSRAAADIRSALRDKALLLEHVGSTSVPGLAAKPIIDIVLGVADSSREDSYVPPLEEHGFALRVREPDWYQHRFFRSNSVGTECNLHVFTVDCEEIDRMLAFRDWLRTHPSDRRHYEDAKRALAARPWKHVQNYADAKSDIVREILRRARKSDDARPGP